MNDGFCHDSERSDKMKKRLLIVEDDAGINQLLSQILRESAYDVDQAFSGTEGKMLIENQMPDLVILDLMLPGLSGDALLDYLRKEIQSRVPVIIISAKHGLDDKVKLLKSGADDYITKPFEPLEVLARVEANLRRGDSKADGNRLLTYKKLKVDPDSRVVTVNDQALTLTGHEFDLIHLLIQNPQKVYSREALYEIIWQGGYYGENNTVNVHVSNIRKKIKAITEDDLYIETVYGIGFKLS